MTAMSEGGGRPRPVSLSGAVARVVLSIVLAVLALFGLVRASGVVSAVLFDPRIQHPVNWLTWGYLALYLLICIGAIAGVLWLRPWKAIVAMSEPHDEDNPETLNTAVMSVLLGFVGMMGLSAAAGVVGALLFDPRIEHPVNWLTWAFLALFLLIGGGGIWGLAQLKPWAKRGPRSPSMRRTNTLFGLSGLVATAACLAVIASTWSKDDPSAPFSNSPIPLWIALFAIVAWLVSWAIAWAWYFSADEHEQRASDVGLLVGGLLFAAVTPAWWVAARAGLLPQPDAMILWAVVNVIWGIGWFWRRNR